MFLVESKLKKLMKDAYKHGLIVANHDGRIYLAGWGWALDIKREYLPKTILAQIIELAGELPDPEERFSATKEGNQMELGEMAVKRGEMGVILNVSKVVILPDVGSPLRVMKTIDFGKVVLLQESVIQMIEERCIDSDKGELYPSGPMYVQGEGIYWWNNVMRFKVMYRVPEDAEQELVKELEEIEL